MEHHLQTRWYNHHTVIDYLTEIHRFCGEQNLDLLDGRVPDILVAGIFDIHRKLECLAGDVAPILNHRHWNQSRLQERGPHSKPRLDVYVTLTSKGNLSVLWWPQCDGDATGKDTDFSGWGKTNELNDYRITPYRPNNELLFVHGVAEITLFETRPPWRQHVDRLLLYASRSMTHYIVEFIGNFCEVRLITDFNFDLNENQEVSSWRIVDVADHWVDTFAANNGMNLEDFIQAVSQHRDSDGSILSEKASRTLRARGHATMLPKTVETLAQQYDYYRQWPGFDRRQARKSPKQTGGTTIVPIA